MQFVFGACMRFIAPLSGKDLKITGVIDQPLDILTLSLSWVSFNCLRLIKFFFVELMIRIYKEKLKTQTNSAGIEISNKR